LIVLMPIAQSKRKLIAATALFVAIGALIGAIATGGASTISFATTAAQQGGGDAATGQQGGQQQGRIVQQGTVTSSPVPLPGLEGQQRATILPLTEDGSIYSGVLTYTATEPVNVVILNVQDLNQTERAILNDTEDGELGTLLTAQLDNQTSLAITQITPEYGDAEAPSASIPFAGNAVWLHLAEDTPFAATYAVSAQTQQPETTNNISNMTLTATAEEDEEAAADEEEAAADEEEAAADEEEAAADGGAVNATNGDAVNATNGDVDGA
jgi:hypothetical protein